MPHPYLTLNVSEKASSKEIRQAYMKLIQLHPPETSPTEYQEINQAYSSIKDEYSRTRLKLFGQINDSGPLSEIIPSRMSTRSRAGIEAWLSCLRKRKK